MCTLPKLVHLNLARYSCTSTKFSGIIM
eukprot:SAG31_NODE_49426_length_140_cov_82.000000_1_plen_27_part_10